MYGTFRLDKSIIGHTLEAGGVSLALAFPFRWLFNLEGSISFLGLSLSWVSWQWTFSDAFLLTSALMLWWYWGREKRDCETGWHDDKGNKLKSGDPRAWFLMWVRWQNLLDMIGPIAVHLLAWGIYLRGSLTWLA